MLKRLIEVALPLKEVSEASAREKSIRHGHISTLHIWWARRPLAACRAVVFASLIPDPDDPECPDSFPALVNELLPQTPNGEDTPRNRCLEFIKHLVKWENSNNEELIGKARKLIAVAHKFLHPESKDDMPKVLDPFAGGGAIPLEALRLGCDAHAIDLNPVAHLIELCTLVYPQKYGQPNSRPTPDYIKKLETAHEAKDGDGLFSKKAEKGKASGTAEIEGITLTRLPLITDVEYQKNPLAADVKFWGYWVLEKARDEIGQFYPPDPDGSVPVAYLWARTVKCPNPACRATIPLVRQLWLCKKPNRRVALRMIPDSATLRCRFAFAEDEEIDFDPEDGTVSQGKATCPCCGSVVDKDHVKTQSKKAQMGQQLLAVAMKNPNGRGGVRYRLDNAQDAKAYELAVNNLERLTNTRPDLIPTEPISVQQPRVMFVTLYGLKQWNHIFNDRQIGTLLTFCAEIQNGASHVASTANDHEYSTAVATYLGLTLNRVTDYCSSLSRWDNSQERNVGTFGRQCLPMVWDYGELVPTSHTVGCWGLMLPAILRVIDAASCKLLRPGDPRQGSATRLPYETTSMDAIITDPPYYDAIPYAELSDFFYVWLKRSVGKYHKELFQSPTTPKVEEVIEQRKHSSLSSRKDAAFYETKMGESFRELRRTLTDGGVGSVMFAHKTTTAWEALIGALLRSGMQVSASWPLHTEGKTRLRALNSASLASSVTLVCRKRLETAGEGYWDDVRDELREVAHERLDFFWRQGIRGADFFISAIGPALSVYGRYAKVTRLTGEEVSVGQFLDEVRRLVTDYALSQILAADGRDARPTEKDVSASKKGKVGQASRLSSSSNIGQIDSETRFYVLWKWSYGDGKVPADEAFKLSQALGIATEEMWDRTGVLEKQGQNVQALTVAKRMRIKDLGEPLGGVEQASGLSDGRDARPTHLPTLIDTLHRCCSFRDKGDTGGLSEYLARSGHGRNEKLWTVAQAISEVLPDGDKEKQLLQGLLNQRDRIDEAMKQGELFS